MNWVLKSELTALSTYTRSLSVCFHSNFQRLLMRSVSTQHNCNIKGMDLYYSMYYQIIIHPFFHIHFHSSIHISIHLSIHPSIYPFIHSSIHLFIPLSIHSFIYIFIHPSIHPFIHLSIHSSIFHINFHFSVNPSIHPFVCPSIHPSIHPSIQLIYWQIHRNIIDAEKNENRSTLGSHTDKDVHMDPDTVADTDRHQHKPFYHI